jgi:hypothetical protein
VVVPLYIVFFNRVTLLKGILDYFEKISGVVPVIVDNHSTYGPAVDFLKQTHHKVIRLPRNLGVHGLWQYAVIKRGQDHKRYFGDDYYAVTDADLDFNACPTDVLDVLREGLHRYLWACKSGVGLETGDIPEGCLYREEVIAWESQFWTQPLDDRFFHSPVASTLFLAHCDYQYNRETWIYNAIRSNRPYVARHLPWYETLATLTHEDRYYYNHIEFFSHWGSKTRGILKGLT